MLVNFLITCVLFYHNYLKVMVKVYLENELKDLNLIYSEKINTIFTSPDNKEILRLNVFFKYG